MLMHLSVFDDTSGIAAQTGSLLHAGIAAWHTNGKDYAKAVQAMRIGLIDFPDAIFDEADDMLRGYCGDPRNIGADVIAVEQKITATIPCHPSDKTGQEIVLQGTVDQIRNDNGMLRVYDVKSSKRDGTDLVNEHTMQVAAYCYLAHKALNRRVDPGALILTRKYLGRNKTVESPAGVFVEFPWDFQHLNALIENVKSAVARLRAGEIEFAPGDYCRYCPAQGVNFCIPELQELTLRVK